MKDWIRNLPKYAVSDYDLGKHWPETGDYKEWLSGKLEDFQKNYALIGYDTYSTYSGGTGLIAKGMTKEKLAHIENGGCFACSESFEKPELIAEHLVDRHCWTEAGAMEWLRNVLEEEAFHDEL